MKKTRVLEDLIKKYKLVSPISFFDRRKILRSKRKTLSRIVKSEISDSVFVSAAVLFDHLLNRIGMRATLAGGFRAFAGTAVISFLVVISASLTVFYNLRTAATSVSGIPEYRKGFIILAEGDVKIVRNRREITDAREKKRIITGDRIVTGADGRFLFQMEKSLVHLMPGSAVSAGIRLKTKSISLEKGTLLCSVKSLEGDERFRVNTPNARVVVTGTLFSVTYKDETTQVSVSEGVVQVINLVSNGEVNLEEGNTAVIRGESTVKKPGKTEMQLLRKFRRLKYIENINGIETEELRKAVRDLESKKNERNKSIRIKTLDDIRKKYRRLEEVQLYNGQSFTGAIVSRGSFFTIVTVKGVKRVKAKDVKNVRIIE